MASFSKQWCEKNNSQLPFDFDIEEIANDLEPNHYTPIICEGTGFIAIGKDANNNILLAIPTGTTIEKNDQIFDDIVWHPLEELLY